MSFSEHGAIELRGHHTRAGQEVALVRGHGAIVLAINTPSAWPAAYAHHETLNGDGSANFGDINPFVALFAGDRIPTAGAGLDAPARRRIFLTYGWPVSLRQDRRRSVDLR